MSGGDMRSSMRILVAVAVVAASAAGRLAHADAKADVTAAFTQFVDGVAAGKTPSDLEAFVGPTFSNSPVPKLDATAEVVPSPKVSGVKVVVSTGGKSAWVIAEITAKVPRPDPKSYKDVIKDEKLRASAFLASADGASWHVVAAHWSAGVPNAKTEMCGDLTYWWHLPPSVPTAAADVVKPVVDAFKGMGEPLGADFTKLMSDAKTAVVIGSAPKEKWTSAKAKKLFAKISMSIATTDDDDHKPEVRAGLGPDGEMAWMVAAVHAPDQYCTMYRALFVLQKEKAGWRIVHQHYSEPVGGYDDPDAPE